MLGSPLGPWILDGGDWGELGDNRRQEGDTESRTPRNPHVRAEKSLPRGVLPLQMLKPEVGGGSQNLPSLT